MFMIPSIACCNLPSPSFWIARRCTLSRRDDASLTWTGSILLFIHVQEISFSSKSQLKSMCLRKKIINRGYWLEIPAEYIFYGNDEVIQWAKRTLDGVHGNVKKKSFKMFKIKSFWKKISYFLLALCIFWPSAITR